MEIITQQPENIRTFTFEDGQKLPSAVDLIQVINDIKYGRKPWNDLKKRNPDIINHIKIVKQQGNNVEYITSKGFAILLSDLQARKKSGKDNLKKLKGIASNIAERYYTNDPTLAVEIIDRIDDPEKIEFIVQRGLVKKTQLALTATIKELQGTQPVYQIVNGKNTRSITGHGAKELCMIRAPKDKKRPQTRDYFTTEELINMQFLEQCEQTSLKKHRPLGNNAIEQDCDRVRFAYQNLINKL